MVSGPLSALVVDENQADYRELANAPRRKEIYPGCYCQAVVRAVTYNHPMNKGIKFSLDTLQKVRDGEPFGGTTGEGVDLLPKREANAANSGGAAAPAAGAGDSFLS